MANFIDCQDLIRRCLEVDPDRRCSLEDILRHSWMTSIEIRPLTSEELTLQKTQLKGVNLNELNNQTTQQQLQQQIVKQQINKKDSFKNNKFKHLKQQHHSQPPILFEQQKQQQKTTSAYYPINNNNNNTISRWREERALNYDEDSDEYGDCSSQFQQQKQQQDTTKNNLTTVGNLNMEIVETTPSASSINHSCSRSFYEYNNNDSWCGCKPTTTTSCASDQSLPSAVLYEG